MKECMWFVLIKKKVCPTQLLYAICSANNSQSQTLSIVAILRTKQMKCLKKQLSSHRQWMKLAAWLKHGHADIQRLLKTNRMVMIKEKDRKERMKMKIVRAMNLKKLMKI